MSDIEIKKRSALLQQIESNRNSKAVLYVTGDRQGLEAQIGQDIIDLFIDHLDEIGPSKKISLILYTSGGDTSAAWNLVNLFHMFCDDFEIIAPGKCMSAGTLVSLGADRIVMTKQATLGPIDPTIQHPLGPSIPGASPEARAGVSVEAVEGYLDAIRKCEAGALFEGQALIDLSNKVHPLVLGQIFRSRQQIRTLAGRLLQKHTDDEKKIDQIVDFLCSESGSHDYTINRREAKRLGLNVEKCSEELYEILRQLRHSFSTQMLLREPYDINTLAANGSMEWYEFTRALIESADHGAHHFITAGEIEITEIIQQNQEGIPFKQGAIRDQRKFEGWRKVA